MLDQYSKSGIINAEDLQKVMKSGRKLAVLDATFVLPGAGVDPFEDYKKRHIPGAQFFDIEGFSDQASTLPHMLCGVEEFAAKAGALGIDDETFVVVYGQTGMVMGPARAWWSFRAQGHPHVAVLNGGLGAWLAAGFETESGMSELPPFLNHSVAEHISHLIDLDGVKKLAENAPQGGAPVVFDARPAERFAGRAPEPREGLRSGHIPGSACAPCSVLVDAKGFFKPAAEIRALFEERGYKSGQQAILSCGSGVTACALALGLHHIGEDNWLVYDGSWAEWGQESLNTPVSAS